MSEFDNYLKNVTEKGVGKVHGALFQAVDKTGKIVYDKIAGYDSIEADAKLLEKDAIFKVASCTKLITSIAVLQCVEKGLLDLDEDASKYVPELASKEIVKIGDDGTFVSEPSHRKITARHLLTHTSGFGYRVFQPTLVQWSAAQEDKSFLESGLVTVYHNTPLLFEPGTSWGYGSSLDWASTLVRKLHDGQSFEEYLNQNVWSKVGLSAPFPTFNISKYPDYEARLMQPGGRTADGGLGQTNLGVGDNKDDQEGGSGLALSAKDYLAVLTDIISNTPKLLKPESIDLLFTPHLAPNSASLTAFKKNQFLFGPVAEPYPADGEVNHSLGGLLLQSEVPETTQPKNVLVWGGVSGPVWFASRDEGVAGFFATQISPFGDPHVLELIKAWKRDFWAKLRAGK